MWDDEDNNPYGSFNRRDSGGSDAPGFSQGPSTPPSGGATPNDDPPDFISQPSHDMDEEELEEDRPQQRTAEPKKGGYSSRVEQILYEHPDLDIQIVHAGKNTEGGGGYITYTIRTGKSKQTLEKLHPTLIIPPIPEKHSVSDYAAKPMKAKEDTGIIELRQRMLTTFLNRCRKMKEVREDGVWWRFLDPNASWNEVLHSHPVVSIPKNNLKAPPLDPANPSPGHQYLPPHSPLWYSVLASATVNTTLNRGTYDTGTSGLWSLPPDAESLSESDLDPYFVQFESSSRELEALLQGSMENVNKRLLGHLYKLGDDLMDLGGRLNAFSLSEQSQTVAAGIERIGQACDFTYMQTRDLSSGLSAQFAEPMRESAQFAGIVRSVLKYRTMKRVQEEMTRDELEKKRTSLDSLERSEAEAKRIEQYLNGAGGNTSSPPRRSMSTGSNVGKRNQTREQLPRRAEDDTASIDSDFPPTQGSAAPSANQGVPQHEPTSPTNNHRRGASGNFVTNKIFGRLTHAIHGVVDSDPERARRDQMSKTRESLEQLEQALEVSEKDVKDASAGVLRDLKRFQGDKEDDLRKYMLNFARCHVEWAKRSLDTWEEAKAEVDRINIR
ncbi:Sorting nexin, cytoplasm-to-vacuole targeting pathway/endosomal sorting [Taxawa tesnikishii (nom. ined.)]|nr:Sorting nexin, cytoplasm-to-vacuole targeting pathway/endosomal sorting [Dothideales sp. JES 119]